MAQAKPDRGNNGASPMPKPKPPTTYSPLCKTKNVAAHFGRCKTTLGSKPAYLAPFPLPSLPSLPSLCTFSLSWPLGDLQAAILLLM